MVQNDSTSTEIMPLGLGGSLLYFGVPTLVVTALYWLVLWLNVSAGIPGYYAHLLALVMSIVTLLAGTFFELRREGCTINRQTMVKRLRWRKVEGKDWLWMVIVFAAAAVPTFLLFGPLNERLVEAGVFPTPVFLPVSLNPLSTLDWMTALQMDYGGQVVGNWWPPITLFVVNAVSVTSEEFWWRGIVLPRQEQGMGRWAWVVHGLLWAPFHLFKYWAFIPLFGITLGIAYLAQRRQNTTAAFILHMLVNVGSGVIGTFLVAAGAGTV